LPADELVPPDETLMPPPVDVLDPVLLDEPVLPAPMPGSPPFEPQAASAEPTTTTPTNPQFRSNTETSKRRDAYGSAARKASAHDP
jgi:hypothetical protein